MKHALLCSSTIQGGGKRRARAWSVISRRPVKQAGQRKNALALVRTAPLADIYYIDAFTVRASDVRDDVPLLH